MQFHPALGYHANGVTAMMGFVLCVYFCLIHVLIYFFVVANMACDFQDILHYSCLMIAEQGLTTGMSKTHTESEPRPLLMLSEYKHNCWDANKNSLITAM